MRMGGLCRLSILLVFVTAVPVATAQSDEEAIRKLIGNYVKGLNTGDADAVVDLFMPDGVFMPHGSPAQAGDKAIHTFYRDTLFRQGPIDIKFDAVEVVVLNGWAFARVETTLNTKVLCVFSRTSAGIWKIARLMFNLNGGQ